MDSSERCSTTMALFHMSTQFNILFQCLYAFPSLLFGKNPLTADHESLYLLPSIYQKHKCSRYSHIKGLQVKVGFIYHTHKIITRGLYTFYPIFEGQKRFLRSFFHKILTLCTISIQERFQIKSWL